MSDHPDADADADAESASTGPTRFDLTRTGGFGGLTLRGSVDLAEVPSEQAAEISDLLAQVDFGPLEDGRAGAVRPDEFRYDLRVVAATESHHVVVGDSGASPALRALLARLVALIGPH